jgi:hypothetical protein
LERLQLEDAVVSDPGAAWLIRHRWDEGSPLRRVANAVAGHWDKARHQGGSIHLHGKNIVRAESRLFYVLPDRAQWAEWIEAVSPTHTRPLDCLKILTLDVEMLAESHWR